MMNTRATSEDQLESIDIIHYFKVIYKKKLLLLLTGLIAAGAAFTAAAMEQAQYYAVASVKLSHASAEILMQNNAVVAVRSQDIRPGLEGHVIMTFHKKRGDRAYMGITGIASSPQAAKRLAGEAARIFAKRTRRFDSMSAKKGPTGVTEVVGKPRSAKAGGRELPQRLTLATLIGVLLAAATASAFEYFKQEYELDPVSSPPMQPINK